MATVHNYTMPLQRIVLFTIFYFQVAYAFKILCLLPIGGKSHEHVFIPVIEELIQNNHQVTCVWPHEYQKKIDNQNLKIIPITQIPIRETESMQKVFNLPSTNPLTFFVSFTEFTVNPCESFFQDKQVQLLINGGVQFDLAVVGGFMNECAMTITHLVANQTVLFSPNTIMPWTPVTVPRPSSFVPNMMLDYTDEMSFFQRLQNSFYFLAIRAIHDYHLIPTLENIAQKYVPESITVAEALERTSLIFTNTDPVIISPRPSVPNVVSVGCIHCKKPMPVPKEFEDFIEQSGEEGFILFSLGSNAQSKYLPLKIKQQFLQVFSNLKQRVIWKYEEEMENLLATNIKVTKWMPQQDILGHPKIRLFITHGGLLSLQQAVYNAVPVIGIPLFSDQRVNMARVEQLQIGLRLEFNNITAKNLEFTINTILQNKKFPINMKKYSEILRQEMDNPVKRAVYWMEYVIRSQKGNHLRNNWADQLNFMEYFLIDLLLIIIAILILTIMLVKLIRFFVKKIRA